MKRRLVVAHGRLMALASGLVMLTLLLFSQAVHAGWPDDRTVYCEPWNGVNESWGVDVRGWDMSYWEDEFARDTSGVESIVEFIRRQLENHYYANFAGRNSSRMKFFPVGVVQENTVRDMVWNSAEMTRFQSGWDYAEVPRFYAALFVQNGVPKGSETASVVWDYSDERHRRGDTLLLHTPVSEDFVVSIVESAKRVRLRSSGTDGLQYTLVLFDAFGGNTYVWPTRGPTGALDARHVIPARGAIDRLFNLHGAEPGSGCPMESNVVLHKLIVRNASPLAGENVDIDWVVRNKGKAVGVPMSLRVYMSDDEVFDATDTELFERSIDALGTTRGSNLANGSEDHSWSVSGTFFVGGCLGPANGQGEDTCGFSTRVTVGD